MTIPVWNARRSIQPEQPNARFGNPINPYQGPTIQGPTIRMRIVIGSSSGNERRQERIEPCHLRSWPDVLGSERLTDAALEHLTRRCQILETNGESDRLQDAKRRPD